MAVDFFTTRKIVPTTVLEPSTLDELSDLYLAYPTYQIVGSGLHVRHSDAHKSNLISTRGCNTVLQTDKVSNLVRVGTGMTWGELKSSLKENQLTVSRFALYPDDATIGGLLARKQASPRALWDGDLRTQCCALSVTLPDGDYRYIAAPRKSSGPDLRYLFFGSEGRHGLIRDATFAVWPESDGLLLTYEGHVDEIGRRMLALLHLGVRISWVFAQGQKSEGIISIAIHGTKRVLAAVTASVQDWFEVEPYEGQRDAFEADLSQGIYPVETTIIPTPTFEKTVGKMKSWICTGFDFQNVSLLSSKVNKTTFKSSEWYDTYRGES